MNIAALKIQLIKDEGLRLRPYTDTVGKITIGVGRNLEDVGITSVEADFLLTNDIQKVQAQLNSTMSWWAGLSDNRQLVIANMAFNMGVPRLLGFKRMWEALEVHNYVHAADEMMDSKWAGQVGTRAIRLAKIMKGGQ